MRLQSVAASDAAHGRGARSQVLGQRAGAPVRDVGRLVVQGDRHDARLPLSGDRCRSPGARLILAKRIDAASQEPLAAIAPLGADSGPLRRRCPCSAGLEPPARRRAPSAAIEPIFGGPWPTHAAPARCPPPVQSSWQSPLPDPPGRLEYAGTSNFYNFARTTLTHDASVS